MRELEKLIIEYLGYQNPLTEDELELELLGLSLAAASINRRQCHLKQALKVAQMKHKSLLAKENSNDE